MSLQQISSVFSGAPTIFDLLCRQFFLQTIRNLLAGRSWVRVPAIATFSHIVSNFSRYRSCHWIALTTYSGKGVGDTFPAIKNRSMYRTRTGMGGLRERNLVM